MRTDLPLAVVLAVLLAGCNQKRAEPKVPESATTQAQDAGAPPAPSKDGLVSLSTDPNPYISNNAKHALTSWKAKDYIAAAMGLRKILNLCRSTAQQDAALSSLAQLKLEIDDAAAKGNKNAKAAAEHLAAPGSP